MLQGRVKQKLSARGKYVSVNIGPVQVVSSEQVFLSCILISFPLVELNLCSLFFLLKMDLFVKKHETPITQTLKCVSLQMTLGEYTFDIQCCCCCFQVQAVYNAMRRDYRVKYFL